MTHPRVLDYEKLKKALTTAPVLAQPDHYLPFIIYVDGLGASLHQEFLINDKIVENPIPYISRHIKPTEKRYAESQMECLALVWSLEKLHY